MASRPCGAIWTKKGKKPVNIPIFRARISPMSFDPKIIAAEDPPLTADGDIDLPADFAALGEQLRDDAVHLVNRYPARASKAVDIPAAQKLRLRRVFAVAGLVTSVVAASLIALGV